MGLPSWLGGRKKTSPASGTPGAPAGPLLAPPPTAPPNLLATTAGFAATNAARRQRSIAAASAQAPVAKQAPAQTPTPKKLVAAGRSAMGLY